MRSNIIFILLFLFTGSWSAQDLLTIKAAVDTALANNLQIQIVRNELEIAGNNNNAGNAGMLPSVALNIGDTPANSNIRQEFLNGTTIERDGVASNNFNAQLALSMTLYDGGKMFATRERLKELEALGSLALNAEIQNLVSNVINAYTRIIADEKYLAVLVRSIEVSEDRLKMVKFRQEVGMANESDVLLAQLDVDQRQQALSAQQLEINNAYVDLNTLLGIAADRKYKVEEKIEIDAILVRSELDNKFDANPELKMSQSAVNIALHAEKEAASSMYPRLGLSAAYGYSLNQSQAGFSLYSQNYGPAATITLSIPLFSGNVNKTAHENAIIQKKNAELRHEQNELFLRAQYEKAWDLYNTSSANVLREETNVTRAETYLNLINDRFMAGQSTIIDFREAQRSFEDANFRYVSQLVLLKTAETDLLRLSGSLLK
jgi:outer membrane protein